MEHFGIDTARYSHQLVMCPEICSWVLRFLSCSFSLLYPFFKSFSVDLLLVLADTVLIQAFITHIYHCFRIFGGSLF